MSGDILAKIVRLVLEITRFVWYSLGHLSVMYLLKTPCIVKKDFYLVRTYISFLNLTLTSQLFRNLLIFFFFSTSLQYFVRSFFSISWKNPI